MHESKENRTNRTKERKMANPSPRGTRIQGMLAAHFAVTDPDPAKTHKIIDEVDPPQEEIDRAKAMSRRIWGFDYWEAA
jgi:hypothetical protein